LQKKLRLYENLFFGNLSKEQILNGNVKTAVDEVSKALIARARATAIAGKLGELAAKRLELEEKREKAIIDIQKQQLYVRKQIDKAREGKRTLGTSEDEFAKINLQALVDQYNDVKKEIADLDDVSKKYSDREAQSTKDSILLLKEKVKAVKAVKAAEFQPKNLRATSEVQSTGLADLSQLAVVNGQVDQFGNKMKSLPGVITTSMGDIRVAFDTSGQSALAALMKFNEDANAIITNSIASTFSGLGDAIGNALANGTSVIGAIGNALLGSLGAFLSDMGKLLIQYGTLAVVKGKLDLAILAGGPVAIGAGVAAIAVGVLLSAAGAAISSRASKGAGGSSGDVSTGASYSSPSVSAGFSSGASTTGGTVVFEIAGTSLIGVLNNTTARNLRIGGRN